MMIDDIEDGIAAKLYEIFGDGYEIELDELKQDFKPPGFWILELATPQTHVIRNRYLRNYNFDVQYFPSSPDGAVTREINRVSDALLLGLEYITAGSDLIRGTDIHYEVQDDVLHFFVTYERFVLKVPDEEPLMEELIQTQHTKGDD